MAYTFGERSNQRREGVNPLLIECSDRALSESRYDMTIPWMGGVRTAEEQNEIFKAGNSKCDGYDKLSYHQPEASPGPWSDALDVIPVGSNPYAKYRELNHFAQCMYRVWQKMIEEGRTEGYILEWGGLWGESGWDKPHWQIVKR